MLFFRWSAIGSVKYCTVLYDLLNTIETSYLSPHLDAFFVAKFLTLFFLLNYFFQVNTIKFMQCGSFVFKSDCIHSVRQQWKGGRGGGVAQWWGFCAVPVANRGHPRAEDVNRLKVKRFEHIKGGE